MKNVITKSETEKLHIKAVKYWKMNNSHSGSLFSGADALKLIHELDANQMKLELQNKELVPAWFAARQTSEKYADLYNFSPLGYFTLSDKGKIIDLNPSGADMLGKEEIRLKNKQFDNFVSNHSRPIFDQFLKNLFNSNANETCEVTLSTTGIVPLHVYISGFVTGNREQCHLNVLDITDRILAEEAMLVSETKYRRLFESAKDGILILNAETGKIVDVNPFLYKLLGLTKEKLIDQEIWEIGLFKDIAANKDKFIELQQKKYVRYEDLPLETIDGRKINVEFVSNLYLVENTKVIQCNIRNITERVRTKELLSASESRYRRLFEAAKDGILILDALTGKIKDVNPFLIKLLGYSEDEIIEKEIWDLGFFKDIAANKEKFFELQEKKYVRYEDLPLETADGKKIHVEFVSNVYMADGHKVIQCNIRDITERKQAEAELHEKEVQYSNLANSGTALIRTSGKDNLCNYFNEPWLHFRGRTLKQEMGKGWTGGIHADDIDRYLKTSSAAYNKREAFEIEYRLLNAKGEYRWIMDLDTPNYNSNGEFIGYIMNCFDINQLKQSEKELIEAKENAEKSDQLKTTFLANMSHEIRTPMNGILGFTELLKEAELTGETQQKYISIIEKSGTRMLNIINDIISISKVESGQMEVIITETNINEQLEYLYTFFKPAVELKNIQLLHNNATPDLEVVIQTDREKVYAILTNLIKNAIKFTFEGTIEFGYKKKGNYLEFFVKDTGIGIGPTQMDIVFERFRQANDTLTRDFEGAGLGLSISRAYVEMLGGKIWVKSKLGKGSTFFFTIPLFKETDESNGTENDVPTVEEEPRTKSLKILIAEDDEPSETLISIAVEKFGKEIIVAKTGKEAVEASRNNPDIDLVLMDIQLPGMDGYEATRQIREFNKDVIIIAQTANALTSERERVIQAGCNDYIPKPFSQASLKEIIQKHFN